MRNYILLFLVILAFPLCNTKNGSGSFYLPAEWEEQESIIMGWDPNIPDAFPLTLEILKALDNTSKVIFISGANENFISLKQLLTDNHFLPDVFEYLFIPVVTALAPRDMAPVFVINKKEERKVIDFENAGKKAYINFLISIGYSLEAAQRYATFLDPDAQVDKIYGIMKNEEIVTSWLTLDGGAIEVNGKGSIILNEYWMLKYNPGVGKKSIEKELKRTLGLKKFIWVPRGLIEDPPGTASIIPGYFGSGTDGHTDNFVRFINPNVILLAWVSEADKDKHPIYQQNYERLSAVYDILKNAKDQDGKLFKIIKIPMPDLITRPVRLLADCIPNDSVQDVRIFPSSEGYRVGDIIQQVPVSSYLNFLITNKKILLPTYNTTENSKHKEEEVRRIFTELYPDREIVFIDALSYNWNGGGIHCFAKQIPVRKKGALKDKS